MNRALCSWLILFGVVLFTTTASVAQFKETADINVSPYPYFISTADFNNDGIPDLAVSLVLPNNVAVLLGAGDGTFPTRFVFGSGERGTYGSLAVGDFNEDRNVDIGVLYYGFLNIYAGNGDGTFHLLSSATIGSYSVYSTVADFNHDGHLDIATANNASSDLSVLLGNGDGTFQPTMEYPLVFAPAQVRAVDVNNDGNPDLVTDLACSDSNCTHGEVDVLLNNGDGTFQAPLRFDAGIFPQGLAAADLNKDGKVDVVVTNVPSTGGTVSVLLGNGDGTFGSPMPYPVESGPLAVAIADFDGDGNPDLAVANGVSNTVSLLRGNGDGTFQPARSFFIGHEPTDVLAADFNGDGLPDLAFPLLYAHHIDVFTNQRSVFGIAPLR